VVFNTIACLDTHLNSSLGVGLTSCTSTAGERDLASITMLQQQASAQGNGRVVSTDSRNVREKSITVLKQFRHSF
jgi:hypothetical protein